jgi:hypothetical protein
MAKDDMLKQNQFQHAKELACMVGTPAKAPELLNRNGNSVGCIEIK